MNLTLKSKLIVFAAITLMAILLAQFVLLTQYLTLQEQSQQEINQFEYEKLQINTIEYQLKKQLSNWQGIIKKENVDKIYHAYLESYYQNEREIFKIFEALKKRVQNYGQFAEEIALIDVTLNKNREQFREVFGTFLRSNTEKYKFTDQKNIHLDSVNHLMQQLQSHLHAYHYEKINLQSINNVRSIQLLIIVTVVLSLIGLTGFIFALQHFISKPLKKALDATTKIASGEMTYRLENNTKDEMGNFSQAFNEMIDRVEENRMALEAANMKISQHTEELEYQVASRTMQLAVANSELSIGSVVFENSLDAIMIVNEYFRIIRINQAFEKILKYEISAVEHEHVTMLFPEEWQKKKFEGVKRDIKNIGKWRGEFKQITKDGSQIITWLSVKEVHVKGEVFYIFNFNDITDRKKSEKKLWRQANFDYVTELPNRSMFLNYAQQAIFNQYNEHQRSAILFIDIDGFKRVNDSLGHQAGDELLKKIGERLAKNLADTEMLARIGGDEFVMFVHNVESIAQILNLAESIIKHINEPFVIHSSQDIHMGGDIGIALYPDHATTLEDLINCADTAMYSAKRSGLNSYAMFEQSMNDEAKRKLTVDNDLRAASEEDFHLYLQPIVDNKGRLISCEGLVRWIHPQKGMIPPDAFISIAEDTGFITTLGKWVTLKAKHILKDWAEKGIQDITLSINLSPKQIVSNEYTKFIKVELGEENIRHNLIIEITENVMMQQNESSFEFIDEATAMGIRMSLDDFGTGYSSLSYIKRYKANYIKIDRSFVSDITTNAADRVICEAIIAIGQAYDLKVIAEGVETVEQFNFLNTLGCDAYQGYFFSRPLPLAEFEDVSFKVDNRGERANFNIC